MPEWFADDELWAELADLMFPPSRFEAAANEVGQLLELVGNPTGKVLDLCCGPGRHSITLAARGFQVTGVDRSRSLLSRAAEGAVRAGVHIEWVHSDMREFVRPASFTLIINLFTSFGYFDDLQSDLRVLRNMRESLQPGGAAVIDVMSKEVLARIYLPNGFIHSELPDGSMLVGRSRIRHDWTGVTAWYTAVRPDRPPRTFELSHSLYSASELKALAREAGFAEVRCYGNLAGAEYGPAAERLVVVARKAY